MLDQKLNIVNIKAPLYAQSEYFNDKCAHFLMAITLSFVVGIISMGS